jgi:hypothetical protein
MRWTRRHSLLLVPLTVLFVAIPVAARADDGRDGADVRVERSCTARSTVRLRVRARDDEALRVDLEVRAAGPGTRWAVVMIHERRLVLETSRRTGAGSRSFAIRITIPDWPGPDSVTVRATGPRGEVCRVTATVPES